MEISWIILTKVEEKSPKRLNWRPFSLQALTDYELLALRISSLEKTEMTHGWQVAMAHMVKSRLNHLKHISLTDWAYAIYLALAMA